MKLTLTRADRSFTDWVTLLSLIQSSYAYMEGQVDPPSSLHSYDTKTLKTKSREEILWLAYADRDLVGSIFGKVNGKSLYVGKLAIDPEHQGKGIGGQLMKALETEALERNLEELELEVRIELTGNQKAFAAMGFHVSKSSIHEGYDKVTFLEMRKKLNP